MDSDLLAASWAQYAEDLWLNRRHKVGEIIDHLSSLASGQTLSEDLAVQVNDLIRFLKFLETACSGNGFTSDRQWSELLNTMEISKRLNHKTVKLKDIMRNRHIIEVNSDYIQELNAVARVGRTIENSLKDLDSLLQTSQLSISTFGGGLAVGEISTMIDQMRGKYLPQVRYIKSEIDNGRLVKSFGAAAVDTWRVNLRRLELSFTKLGLFLDRLTQLESKLHLLEPLMSVQLDNNSVQSSVANDSSLNSKIQACRKSYHSVILFRAKLVKALEKLARSKTSVANKSIPLFKMIDKQCNFVDSDLFDSDLSESLDTAVRCREDLDKVMQDLRLEFSRFYFVNDVELLTIIAHDTNLILESDSKEHSRLIRKLFCNSIAMFIIRENTFVAGVESPLGEKILLPEGDLVPIRKKVNVYSVEIVRVLNELMRKLRRHLRNLTLTSHRLNGTQMDWTLPVQLVVVRNYLIFTERVEQCFAQSKENTEQKLRNIISSYQSAIGHGIRSDRLSELKRAASSSLAVGFINVLMMLKSERVNDASDWNWQKQARYYVADDKVEVQIAGSKFEYKFDYLHIEGVADEAPEERATLAYKRLISTKVTQGCMLVASYAVCNLGLGANPYGPAGSGKTETIKALGNLLGCHVVVHNCDDSNDSESLERLIWGLAHTGFWGCFDEFNRLSSSVLSSVSGVLEEVQVALREGQQTVQWQDGQIKCIDPSSAFFITFNPGDGDKYRGRRQIPANLRSLFVPVSMVQLEIVSIVSESLMNSGCCRSPEEAMDISNRLGRFLARMRKAFKGEEGIHCEWDLRLVIAILDRLTQMMTGQGKDCRQFTAEAIFQEVKSRVPQDKQSFVKGSLASEFDMQVDLLIDDKIMNLREKMLSSGAPSELVESALNFYAQLQARTGVILIGPAASGKSSCWGLLHKSLGNERVKWQAINPRSCIKLELFGCVQSSTRKWIDGVFTRKIREAQKTLSEENELQQVWLVLDGPIDPDWVEQLNSALDDNKTLTLSSGERLDLIPVPSKAIKLVFETTSVQYASPATVSRLGLVLFEGEPRLRAPINLREDDFRSPNPSTLFRKNLHDRKISIIAGAGVQQKKSFIAGLIGDRLMAEYTCNELSKASHLRELLERCGCHEYIIINNIDAVSPEDQWGTRSFIELLRHTVTYGAIDQDVFSKTVSCQFIATVTSVDLLDNRLVAVSQVVHLDSFHEDTTPTITFDGLVAESDRLGPIFALDSAIYGIGRCSLLENTFKDWTTWRFSGLNKAKLSIERLENIVSIGRPEVKNPTERSLFILHDAEFRLIPPELRAKLAHLMNWLKWSGQRNTIIACLCHKLDEHLSESKFWSTIGRLYYYEHATSYTAFVSHNLESCGLSDQDLKRFTREVVSLIEEKRRCTIDLREARSFLQIFHSSTRFVTLTINSQRATITNGLKRLMDFERGIEGAKSRLKRESENVATKKREVESLMRTIDKTLEDSSNRKKQLEELRVQQDLKNKQIEQRSSELQRELASVELLVNESKREISKHLRPEALNEIKTLRSPPKTIKDILDVLFVLLELKDTSWTSIKSYLTRHSLIDELAKYDFQKRLNEPLLARVEAEIEAKGASFNLKQAARASSAVTPILKWIEAALSYGKVLIKLRPLISEMDKLRSESSRLEEGKSKLEMEQAQVDESMSKDSRRLKWLKSELGSAETTAIDVQRQLDLAQKVRTELNSQLERWKLRLNSFSSLNDGNQIARLTLLAAYLAIYHDGGDIKSRCGFLQLGDWTESISTLLSLQKGTSDWGCGMESSRLNEIVDLLAVKLIISNGSSLVPFLHLDSKTKTLNVEQLISFLRYKDIVCSSGGEICHIKCGEQHISWRQSLDMAIDLNKLLLIELEDSSCDLDLMDLILGCKSKRGVILFGQLDEHFHLRHLIRPIAIASKHSPIEQLTSKLTMRLTEGSDPKLSKMVEQLEFELEAKQIEQNDLENVLLRKLANYNGPVEGAAHQLDESLVELLSKLNRISEKLTNDIGELRGRMNNLSALQSDFVSLARSAAEFYSSCLLDLSEINRFYGITTGRYIDLLLHASNRSDTSLIDYAPVIEHVLNSMKPEDKAHFRNRLTRLPNYAALIAGQSSQMEKVIRDLLTKSYGNETCKLMIVAHDAKKSNPLIELDEIFSQFLANDKVGQKKQASMETGGDNHHDSKSSGFVCSYKKVYASSDSSTRLEAALGNILSISDYEGKGRQEQNNSTGALDIYTSSSIDSVKLTTGAKATARSGGRQLSLGMRCLCIANAHLSARWINTNLVRLMRTQPSPPSSSSSPTTTTTGKRRQLARDEVTNVLIILIVESAAVIGANKCDTTQANVVDHNVIAQDVIDLAQVKYWHDELALPVANRIKLMQGSLARLMMQQVVGGKQIFGSTGDEFASIGRQLIMVHVICQELAILRQDESGRVDTIGGAPIETWRKSYAFDYDQLWFAFKVLFWLLHQNKEQNVEMLRVSLCNYLSALVYGSRMECEEDTRLFEKISVHCIGAKELAVGKLNQLERLISQQQVAAHSGGEAIEGLVAGKRVGSANQQGESRQRSAALADLLSFVVD